MKPPKCKFCNELHWGLCPNVGGKAKLVERVREIERAPPKKAKKKAKKKSPRSKRVAKTSGL